MHEAGFPEWRVEIDEPADLHQLLFVRDACSLDDGGSEFPGYLEVDLPDLTHLIEPSDRAATLDAWRSWWNEALQRRLDARPPAERDGAKVPALLRAATADGSRFSTTTVDGELRRIVIASYDAFRSWWSSPIERAERQVGALSIGGVRGDLLALHFGKHVLRDVVVELEQARGRRIEFSLYLETLAVVGPEVVIESPGYALIAGRLMADDARYREWLRAVLTHA
jgi:hypothetical protein